MTFRRAGRLSTRFVRGTTGLLLVLGAWAAASQSLGIPTFFLPRPEEVVSRAVSLAVDGGLGYHILVSSWRVFGGFLLSAAIGLPLGVVLGVSKGASQLVYPLVAFGRYLPVGALVPLSILWVGIDESQKIVVIFIGTFFQLVPLVVDAARSTPKQLVEAARVLGASQHQVVSRVVIPYAAPAMWDALRVSLGIGWSYLVVAEVVGAASGLGFVVTQAQRYLETPTIFVGLVVLGALGLVSDLLFVMLARIWFAWRQSI